MKTRNRLIILLTIGLISIMVVSIRIKNKLQENKAQITFKVTRGLFEISVTTTGELESENSKQILIPAETLKNIGIWEINVSKILSEGSIIDSGEIVAELDPAKISAKLSEIESSLQTQLTQIENLKADSSLDLSTMRNDLENSKYGMQELEITLKQSIYESPSVIKQAEIALEKAKREYKQKQQNYELKNRKSILLINEAKSQLSFVEKQKQEILDAFDKIKIKSPGKGMLVYQKNFDGKPITSGTLLQVQANTVLALLPDFSSMISTTYVNESDISKIKINQAVALGVDAFPDNKYSGKVIQIANMGAELKGTNTKMFKITIKLDKTDPFLRSGMTTSNKILINSFPDKNFIPLESIHNSGNVNYVFLRKGLKTIKKQVVPGEMNDNFIVIEKGIEAGDEVLITIPEKSRDIKISEL